MHKWIIGALSLIFCTSLSAIVLSDAPSTSHEDSQPNQAVETAPKETASTQSPFQQLEHDLLSRIDLTDNVSPYIDNVMSSQTDAETITTEVLENHSNYFALDSMQYGSFTGADKQEMMVIFSVLKSDHASGFDRKLMVIYDATTGDAIMKHCFAGDGVSITLDSSGSSSATCVFSTTYWMYHGRTYHAADFGSLEGGVWTPIPLPTLEGERFTYHYSDSSDTLTVDQWTDYSDSVDGFDDYSTLVSTTEYVLSWDTLTFEEVS